MVWVNDFGYSFTIGQAAWGGVKGSGFGRTSSKHGLYESVAVKYVDSDRGRLRPAWWFPYDAATERSLRALARRPVRLAQRAAARCVAPPARARARREAVAGPVSELSHVGEAGDVRMVDVGGKPLSRRRAVARAEVRMAAETARRLRELPKGDALATAQVAGIMAAKRTSELIPLCHPLPLSHVEVTLEVRRGLGRDRRVRRDDGADRRRDGGAHRGVPSPRSPSTTWRRRSTRRWSSPRCACSRRRRSRSEGRGADRLRRRRRGDARRIGSGDLLERAPARRRDSTSRGASSRTSATRSPRRCASSQPKARVVLTTGGTGLAPRDVTPEATLRRRRARSAGHRAGAARRLDREDAARPALARRRRVSSARRSSSTFPARRAAAATASPCSGPHSRTRCELLAGERDVAHRQT